MSATTNTTNTINSMNSLHMHHNDRFYDEIINNFFEKHIRTSIGYFEFKNIIESPIISFDELKRIVKESHFKDITIEKYNVQYHIESVACIRDADAINYLIDFLEEGYYFGKKIMLAINENNNGNNMLIVSDNNNLYKAINKITTIGRKYSMSAKSKSHELIIQFMIDLVSSEIIKGIKGQ